MIYVYWEVVRGFSFVIFSKKLSAIKTEFQKREVHELINMGEANAKLLQNRRDDSVYFYCSGKETRYRASMQVSEGSGFSWLSILGHAVPKIIDTSLLE